VFVDAPQKIQRHFAGHAKELGKLVKAALGEESPAKSEASPRDVEGCSG